GLLRGNGCVDVVFESIPANDTKLFFSFTLMDARTAEIYDWKRNVPLRIRGNPKQQGRISLTCSWRFRARHEESPLTL
ncbi:MAG: hypothetical protein ACREYF_23430, partial [Gammaproteobacteria bacterium]